MGEFLNQRTIQTQWLFPKLHRDVFLEKLYAAGSRFGGGDRREMEAFEMKRKKPKAKLPSTFVRSYPDTRLTIVNHENYINFLD